MLLRVQKPKAPVFARLRFSCPVAVVCLSPPEPLGSLVTGPVIGRTHEAGEADQGEGVSFWQH